MLGDPLILLILPVILAIETEPQCASPDSKGCKKSLNHWKSNKACDLSLSGTELCTCSERILGEVKREKWTKVGNLPIEVFSAFMDTRQWTELSSKKIETVRKPEGTVTVRVVGHGIQAEYNDVPPVYCHSEIEGKGESTLLGKADYIRIYQSTLHHNEYTAHFLHCYVPNDLAESVTRITLSDSPCAVGEEDGAVTLPVLPSGSPNPTPGNEPSVALCVSPIYGKMKAVSVVEFVEIHRLLGVEKFYFYLFQAPAGLRKVLTHYQSQGIADVTAWPLKLHIYNYFYFDQRSALNDCLYRASSHDWVGFVDLDEVLVPLATDSLPTLLTQVQKNTEKDGAKLASVCFQHVYFERDWSDPQAEFPLPLMTQTRFSRPEGVFPAGKIRSKSLHRPQYMATTDIHFALWFLENNVEEVILDEKLGVLHHYRPYPMEKFRKDREEFNFHADYFMIRFRPQLSDRINRLFLELQLGIED